MRSTSSCPYRRNSSTSMRGGIVSAGPTGASGVHVDRKETGVEDERGLADRSVLPRDDEPVLPRGDLDPLGHLPAELSTTHEQTAGRAHLEPHAVEPIGRRTEDERHRPSGHEDEILDR